MRRQIAVLVAVVAVVVASVTTALAVTVADDDQDWTGHDEGMPGIMHGRGVDSEYAYLAEMVAHHEEAVAAAEELRRSDRAEMREFGAAIVASQSAQIDQMHEWLGEWYPDRSGRVEYAPMMRDLSDLSGDRLDRAFLRDMLGHHMTAVMMSQRLLMGEGSDHDEVEVLAETIRDEQSAEIATMRRWLRTWFADGEGAGMRGGMYGGMHDLMRRAR